MVRWYGRAVGIVDEDVVRVREASDIVAVVSEHLQLKRVGRSWSGLCPFHSEKSGSLSVSSEKGVYYCFGCGAKGDVITFVREIEHVDFVGAVEILAGKAGITLRYTDRDEGAGRKQRAKLIDAMAAGGRVVPPAAAVGPRCGQGSGLPARARPGRRPGAGLPDRLGARGLGRADQGPEAAGRGGHRGRARAS